MAEQTALELIDEASELLSKIHPDLLSLDTLNHPLMQVQEGFNPHMNMQIPLNPDMNMHIPLNPDMNMDIFNPHMNMYMPPPPLLNHMKNINHHPQQMDTIHSLTS
ncbi:hypothetical protein V8G54_031613 [Vigna mungo]|uniref:Uncharacterized protein n=1 Tax=Vigna mungo TaxID=3915 RepID=A0AAQ3MKF4_VIGMU